MDFHNILFPVDFSQRAHLCAPRVGEMAKRFGASLTLLHAAEFPHPWFVGMEAPVIPEVDWSQIEADALSRLNGFAESEFPGQTIATKVESGDPTGVIEEFVKSQNVDLIAMPTHGRGIFRAALLGSVTAKILHDVDCAVWTGVHATEDARPSLAWNSVLCAIDLTHDSARLIAEAASLHRRFGSTVRLVHAVPGPEAGLEKYFDREFQLFLENAARNSIAELQCEARTSFEVCLTSGSPGRVVAGAVAHHEADLVLIGRGHLRDVAARLRTHAYGIIHNAGCPVISL